MKYLVHVKVFNFIDVIVITALVATLTKCFELGNKVTKSHGYTCK